MRLLIVEDELELATALTVGLRREGYAVDTVHEGATALERLGHTPYDVVCLDVGLPDIDGISVCRQLREAGSDLGPPPRVLLLTARSSLEDRVAGLDAGADDYLGKPFSFRELAARIRALQRRDTANPGAVLHHADIELDASCFVARRQGTPLDLTPKEFALLRYLMLHPGQVLTQERLLEHVWDEQADPFSNTVRVTISTLRRKLAAAGPGQPIETVVGVGYRLMEAA
jgi:DNA-binding response OmpR family regulator